MILKVVLRERERAEQWRGGRGWNLGIYRGWCGVAGSKAKVPFKYQRVRQQIITRFDIKEEYFIGIVIVYNSYLCFFHNLNQQK